MAVFRALAACKISVGKSDPCKLLRASGYIRQISSTEALWGLEEFFPPGALDSDEPALEGKEFKTGRRWHASDLRLKSNSDLHKLWYVLLKERNMLQTVREEAKRLQIPMPGPERMGKVQKSMAMIKVVIGERERALKALEEMGYQSVAEEVMDSSSQQDKIEEPKSSIEATKTLESKSYNTDGNIDKNSHLGPRDMSVA